MDTLASQASQASQASGHTGQALELAGDLAWYWLLRGRLGEARRRLRSTLALEGAASHADARATVLAWLAGFDLLSGEHSRPFGPGTDEAAEAARAIGTPAARGRALWFLGYVLATVGDPERGERLSREALELFRASGDRWGAAAALCDLTTYTLASGQLDAAREAARESAAVFAELGDGWGQVQASFPLGALAGITGDYEEARGHHERSLDIARRLGLWPEVSYQLSWLGRVELLTGDLAGARDLHEQARRVAVEHGFRPGEMYARTGLALGARKEGDLDTAYEHLLALREWHRLVDLESGNTLILAELGFVAEQRGDATAARALHGESLALARKVGDPRACALALEGLAGAHALTGEYEKAARLLGAADRERTAVGAPLPPAERGDVERVTAVITAAIGVAAFAAEHRLGGENTESAAQETPA
ncbi:tetratricopeptide repeat protein [Prauserella marina]|nr:tetratricopeptide repeat protein [Prauserella marina]